MTSIEIARDEWIEEMREKCPSSQAFDAYVALEEFVVSHTELKCTYRRNTRGESHYATFCGSAKGHCSVIQIYGGQCTLNWAWNSAIPGISNEAHPAVKQAFSDFRRELNGSANKSWEQVKVLRLGLESVQQALSRISERLNAIFDAEGIVDDD